MIVVISPEQSVPKESELIHAFIKHGLDYYHVRKYDYSDQEIHDYLAAIDEVYRSRLVLHSHYHLADEYGIGRLHFGEMKRTEEYCSRYSEYHCSTSVHDIDDFNRLSGHWDYAFLSPVFPSISKKGYGVNTTVLAEIQRRENHTAKLIGLGGIQQTNTRQVLRAGFDGFALMGAVWNASDPLNEFLKCK